MRHRLARAALFAAVAWFLVDGVLQIRDFVWKNDGIAFYEERPHLLIACAAAAVAIGLCVSMAANWRRKRLDATQTAASSLQEH